MSKIGKTKMSQAKKKAELTASALGHDFDEKLYNFYEEYSAKNYITILEKMTQDNKKEPNVKP